MAMKPLSSGSAVGDLGLGGMLSQQRQDETEEERKKRLAGLSASARASGAAQALFGFGQIGVPGVAL